MTFSCFGSLSTIQIIVEVVLLSPSHLAIATDTLSRLLVGCCSLSDTRSSDFSLRMIDIALRRLPPLISGRGVLRSRLLGGPGLPSYRRGLITLLFVLHRGRRRQIAMLSVPTHF